MAWCSIQGLGRRGDLSIQEIRFSDDNDLYQPWLHCEKQQWGTAKRNGQWKISRNLEPSAHTLMLWGSEAIHSYAEMNWNLLANETWLIYQHGSIKQASVPCVASKPFTTQLFSIQELLWSLPNAIKQHSHPRAEEAGILLAQWQLLPVTSWIQMF